MDNGLLIHVVFVDENECRRNNSAMSSSVCFIDSEGEIYDNGNTLFFQSMNGALSDKGFYVLYIAGDKCTTDPTKQRRTTLQFVCDDSTEGFASGPEIETSTDVIGDCDVTFVWYSILGCPVCEADDYISTEGGCIDGQQTTVDTRIKTCNGPQTKNASVQSCSTTYKFPIGAVIAAAIAFVALLSVAVFVFIKNRRMSHQYSRLQASFSTKGYELDNMKLTKLEDQKEEKFSIEEEEQN